MVSFNKMTLNLSYLKWLKDVSVCLFRSIIKVMLKITIFFIDDARVIYTKKV